MNTHRELQRAEALLRQDKLPEAHVVCETILREDPSCAPALHLSGLLLYRAGRVTDAIARFREAVTRDPGLADAWSSLGLALNAARVPLAAVEALKRAINNAPQAAEYHANLAAVEHGIGRLAEAEAAARAAIAADAGYAPGWFNLALALRARGAILESLEAAVRANGLDAAEPAYAGLRAQIEEAMGALDKGRATLEAALLRQPLAVPLRLQLAHLLERAGDERGAIGAYEQVLRQQSANGPALSELVFLKRRLGDWRELPPLETRFKALTARDEPLLSPFVMLSLPSTRAEQRRCADTWTRVLAPAAPASRRRRLSHDRLRVGYLSSDFHEHATAYLMAGLLEQHDRTRFEIVAYSTGRDDGSAIRRRVAAACDRFVDLQAADAVAAIQAIHGDAVDVLVDLKGHTAAAPLPVLAARVAPIQAHYLGYPGTLGGTLVDYLIGDGVVTPPEHAGDYAETLVRLPGCYQVSDRERVVGRAPGRAELGLLDAAVVLCNFNQSYKISPEAFDCWMSILREVPETVLWLLARSDADPLVDNLRREAQARGVAGDRIVFANRRPNPDYLALYGVADLFVDTWPYNAHTTGSDALWAGCPVVTWLGDTFASRVGASLLKAVGLPELVRRDPDDYVRTVIALARDPAARMRSREHLQGAGRASALFDPAAKARELESVYSGMAEQYRQIVRAPIDF